MIQIALPRRFPERTHQVFGEMLVGYKLFFDPIFVIDVARGLGDTDSYFRCGS
jgi:hypothetical protein